MNKEKTDIELFKELLNKVGCKTFSDSRSIEIDFDNMLSYGGVTIEFDEDGKFEGFMACD